MHLDQLFPGRDIGSLQSHMVAFAAEFGVEMRVPDHLSNTQRALAMAEFARDEHRLVEFRQAASHGYWTQLMDLEDEGALGLIAERAGLKPQAALDASTSAIYVARVLQTRQRGIEEMVSGVPTLFVGDRPVIGCQRYETFAKVLDQAGVPKRA